MRKTREERKRERSLRASRAAQAGWDRRHSEMAAAGVVIQYEQPHAFGEFEIIVRSLRSGITHTLSLCPGPRRDNFSVKLDGKPWRIAGLSGIMVILRKSLVRTKSGRVI